ncbi:MAG: AsmA family protein [Betaproteobacteria bacterium]|nr:AsmA family protein [Betaproteobacteria bacterium]
MKILKYILLALGGLVILAGAALAYIASTFDPNQYKPQIVKAVKEKTQRTLKLEGDIALSFWPSIGARIGRASLSERASEREFAAVEEAHVSLKLLPLLSKQAIVDTVRIKGLRASVVRAKDGSTNVDDLAGPPPAKDAPAAKGAEADFKVDIAGVEIEDAAIQYADQAAGLKYAFSKLNLKTGRIAPAVPTGIALSVRAQRDKPRLDLQTALKTRLAFDPGRSLALDDLALDAKGVAAGITNLALKATGSAMANVTSGEFTASKLNVSLTGMSGKDALDIKVDVPRLSLAGDKASGDKVAVVAKITGPGGTLHASLMLPGIEGTAQAFRSGAAHLDLDLKRGDLAVKAKLASPVAGNLKARQLNLPKLKASLSASGPNLPGKSIAGELAGSAAVDGAKQSVQANLAGKVSDSQIKAQVGVTGFAPLAFKFNAVVDQLDVDRYLPPKAAGGAPGAAAPKQPEQPFDLTALRGLRGGGTLRFGALKVNNVKASNVRMDVRANGGRVDVSPLTAGFYQGSLSSAVTVNAAPATPTFAAKHNMSGINVGAFLKDLAGNDTLEGRGNVTADVTTQGSTVTALKKALNGNAAVKLTNGAVKGIDIAGSIRNAKARLGTLRGEQTQKADKSQKTDFSELTATFRIANGVARNNDLSLKSPLLRVGGEGEINIGEDTVNYLVKASIVGTTQGQGGRELGDLRGVTVPVRVAGPLANPSYKLDFGAMATETAKQEIKGRLQERLLGGAAAKGAAPAPGTAPAPAPGDSVRDKLRSIFGR